jgi:hypothetical protein
MRHFGCIEVKFMLFLHSTNVKAIYDNNFLDKFGEDTRNAIRRIVAHAQHVFKWPSLTTKIFLNVSSDFQHINERLSANNKL